MPGPLAPFIQKKHAPEVRYPRNQSAAIGATGNKFLFDVQGTIFATIRYAYSTHTTLAYAHAIVLKRIEQLARCPSETVLYLDGLPAEEKRFTHQKRDKARTKALKEAQEKVSSFAERVDFGNRIRKQDFINIKKKLNGAFQWDPHARQGLAEFLRSKGWNVVECETEADVRIGSDSRNGDIVISGDSDMLVYENVSMIWRPVSGSRFLVYNVDEVLAALHINRVQLTTLGIVSINDYDGNIYGLGCPSNLGVIKTFVTVRQGRSKEERERYGLL